MEEIKVLDKIAEIHKATDKALTYAMIVMVVGVILGTMVPYLCKLLLNISPLWGILTVIPILCCYVAIGKWHSNKLKNLK
jgi:hypothetical protein